VEWCDEQSESAAKDQRVDQKGQELNQCALKFSGEQDKVNLLGQRVGSQQALISSQQVMLNKQQTTVNAQQSTVNSCVVALGKRNAEVQHLYDMDG